MQIIKDSIKINYMLKPYIDSNPSVSWKNESLLNGESQAEYNITVYEVSYKGEEIVYCTDWVKSANTVGIPLIGAILKPRTKYRVCVSVKGTLDPSVNSDETYFKTGKLDEPFFGYWISSWYYKNMYADVDSPVLRKEFKARKDIFSAELYICGLGYFETKINGKKVGDDFLPIPFTRYDKHTEYVAYDVKDMISEDNALVVYLGNGFYNCFTQDPWQTAVAEWRDMPKLLCELHITYVDGKEDVIVSDVSWDSGHSPITFNGIRHGESYDANLEEDGIEMPFFETNKPDNWKKAIQVRPSGGVLVLSEQEPIRVRYKLHPIEKKINKRGNFQFRFERDVAGICNINFKGKKGEKIKVIYSDTEDSDGDLVEENSFIKNYYFQTEEYTKKSDMPESYYTRFTYYGFFIMEVVGGEELDLDDIEAWVLCNDFKARGTFECDDDLINKIQQMVKYSTESCCVGTLSADTVREKCSWTGDTGLTAEQIVMNYESEAFMRRWMRDMREAQRVCGTFPCIIPSTGWGYVRLNGPDWSQPSVEVPYRLYESTGDKEFLRENYDELKRHVDNMRNNSRDNIAQFGLGDWCPPFDGPALSVNMSSYKCPVRLSDTAYYYDACLKLSQWASILSEHGLDEYYISEQKKYEELASKIKEKFMSYFYGEEKYENADCQTALGMLLYRKLYSSEEERKFYLDKLVKVIEENGGKLDFGVLGMKAVSNALGENGKAALCLEMLRGPEYPSYGHWVEMGSTTLYECWNGLGSHNHHMFSDVSEFFYKYIAGIRIDEEYPGYKRIIFDPCLDSRVKEVNCEIDTVRGKVGIKYKITDNKVVIYMTIPVGSTAHFMVKDNYNMMKHNKVKDGRIYLRSGIQHLEFKLK